jgi:ABC-type Fe3+/spermidine/putrescine transport system ATPase subunit
MSAIEFKNVSFGWTKSSTLLQADFEIYENEVFALLGSSGCGKSTTLRLISGLLSPSEGQVLVFGKNASSYSGGERCVATVWQSRALFHHMSARSNIEFGLRVQRIDSAERRQRIEPVVKSLRLESLLARNVSSLSGGEQQRVALARSLVIRPSILLLDEPFTGLDQTLKLQLQADLRELRAEYGGTYVMVSHSLEDVFSLADRVAVIDGGRILQIGTPNEVYEEPINAFIAKFVGQRNLIPGVVTSVNAAKGLAIVNTNCGPPWKGHNRDRAQYNDEVFYVLSPEDVMLNSTGELKTEATFRAKETAGRREIYYLRLKNACEIRLVTYYANGQEAPNLAPGEMVDISWNPQSALVLRRP